MVGGFERGVGKQQVSRQTNIRFYWILHPPGEGRPSRLLCLSSTYRHPHSGSWKNSKGTLLVTDEGGEHLSLTPTSPWSETAVPSGRPRTLCYPLGCSLLRGLAFTFSFRTASFTTSVPLGASTSVFPRNWNENTKQNKSMMWLQHNRDGCDDKYERREERGL